jgi:hypothetical protein
MKILKVNFIQLGRVKKYMADFWQTIRGVRMADTITKELVTIANHLKRANDLKEIELLKITPKKYLTDYELFNDFDALMHTLNEINAKIDEGEYVSKEEIEIIKRVMGE